MKRNLFVASLIMASYTNVLADTEWSSPSPYQDNMNEWVKLEITDAENITVSVTGETERSYDFIYIWNEDNSTKLKTFHGHIDESFDINSNSININFKSDYSVARDGVTVTIEEKNNNLVIDELHVKEDATIDGDLQVTNGNLTISGEGKGIVFPDGSVQTTAPISESGSTVNNLSVADSLNVNGATIITGNLQVRGTSSGTVPEGACIIDENALSGNGIIHYSLAVNHPSGSIGSSRNLIHLRAFTIDNGYNQIAQCTIGTFTGESDKYNMHYSSEDKPENGYSRYSYYEGTSYEGLITQSNMYASQGKNALKQLISNHVDSNSCAQYSSNYSGGNLNRDDNFWTYFCPKAGLIDYIDSTIRGEKAEISVSNGYIKLDITSGQAPAESDCNNASHEGRMVLDNVNETLYVCTKNGWIGK